MISSQTPLPRRAARRRRSRTRSPRRRAASRENREILTTTILSPKTWGTDRCSWIPRTRRRRRSTAPTRTTSRSGSSEDLFGLVPFEEIAGSQQPRGKPRSLQKLTSRQRRPKQDAAKSNGKRHHGPAGGAKKPAKPAYRTPERARRHRRAGRRDSQSSSEFLTVSDSKENISVALPDGLPAEDSLLDPFGAKPFHPADLPWHPPHQGLGDSNPVLPGRPRPGSLHGAFHGAEALKMDDFGAVPFTELVVHGLGSQQPQQPQPGDLDPFGAAPFPSKQ